MPIYLLTDDSVTALSTAPGEAPEGAVVATMIDDIISADLPMARLVTLWNSLPGMVPVTRFRDRADSVERLWNAMQDLQPVAATPPPPVPTPERGESKQAQIVAMLRREQGARIEEIMAATGWQRHTVRGAISGAIRKKLGLTVTSTKTEAGRIYRIADIG